MNFRALVFLLLAASHLLAVDGLCMFPPDYLPPYFWNITRLYTADTVYAYTDPFGGCSGCVTELSVCYSVFSDPNPMRVVIVNEQNTIVHVHSFSGPATSTENQDTLCEDFGSFSTCCSYETLTASEQFVVQSTDHYGVWSQEQLAIHATETEQGHYVTQQLTPLEVGVNINSSTYNIQKIYFHFIITPGSCESNISISQAIISPNTIPMSSTPTTVFITPLHPISPSLFYSSGEIIPTSSNPTISSSLAEYTPTTTPLQQLPPHTLSPHPSPSTSNVTDTGTGAGTAVAPYAVGASLALVVVTALLTLLLLRYRASPKLERRCKSASLGESLRSRTASGKENPPNLVLTNSNPAYACSRQQREAVGSGKLPKPMVIDSNPAYALSSRENSDKNPVYDYPSLKESSVDTKPIEIDSNPAYGVSSVEDMDSNPAYACFSQTVGGPTPIEIPGLNPAYITATLQGQKDEVYSYIPSEEGQVESWTACFSIPTSGNEAYASTAALQEKVEEESDEGYVVNSLVYEVAPDELKTGGDPHNESKNEVSQLIYSEIDATGTPENQ